MYSNTWNPQSYLKKINHKNEEAAAEAAKNITPDMNEELQKPYTAEEVHKALFMMGANKVRKKKAANNILVNGEYQLSCR